MQLYLYVFLGGGLGCIMRLAFSKIFNAGGTAFPWGTLTANILGSLFIGFVLGWALKNHSLSQNQLGFLVTGFCGGLTTFSTFAYENQFFLKNQLFFTSFLYTVLSFALALAVVFLGVWLARLV